MTIRKVSVWIILFLLIVTPFINWRLGAVLWLCAWIIYILQMVFAKFQTPAPEPSPDESPAAVEDDKNPVDKK